MQISTFLKPNIHQNGLKILWVKNMIEHFQNFHNQLSIVFVGKLFEKLLELN
jgi:hypothetical protein